MEIAVSSIFQLNAFKLFHSFLCDFRRLLFATLDGIFGDKICDSYDNNINCKVEDESLDALLPFMRDYWEQHAANKSLLSINIYDIGNSPSVDRIPTEVYSTYPELKELLINADFVKEITVADATNAKNLTKFRVAYSKQMDKLTAGTFVTGMNLEVLELFKNQISHIDDLTFTNLSSTLQQLVLNGNQLTTISKNTFARLGELTVLGLRENQIHAIENGAFVDLKKLIVLDLSLNKLKVLSDNIFSGPTALVTLHLQENQIENVGNALYILTALEDLHIEDNPIKDIDLRKFTKAPKNLVQTTPASIPMAEIERNS